MSVEGALMKSEIAYKLQSLGHEIVPERGTYIDGKFKMKCDPKKVVRLPGGAQALLDINGAHVTVGRLLPERAALVLDDDAVIVEQAVFAERYAQWLNGFEVKHVQPGFEPVPNGLDWLLQEVDPEKDYLSYIPLGFDREATGAAQATGDYSPLGNKLDAAERARVAEHYGGAAPTPAGTGEAEVLTKLLADGDLTQEVYLRKMKGLFVPVGEDPAEVEAVPAAVLTVPAEVEGVAPPAGKDVPVTSTKAKPSSRRA